MIYEKIASFIKESLKNKELNIELSTILTELPKWDSFCFIDLMVYCENEFNIKFKPKEIEVIKNIFDLEQIISIKINE